MSPGLLVLGTLLAARPTGIDALRVALAAERPAATPTHGAAPALEEAADPVRAPAPRPNRRGEAMRDGERVRQAAATSRAAVETPLPSAAPTAAPVPPLTPRSNGAAPTPPTTAAATRPGPAVSSDPGRPWAWFLPAGALLLLAGGAALAARKRHTTPRWIRILETSSLGPKRSLVVAQVGAETLVLGISESGISLLTTARALDRIDFETPPASALTEAAPARAPAPVQAARDTDTRPVPVPRTADAPAPPQAPAPGPRPLLWAVPPARNPVHPPFGDLLIESSEDQELRRKLALGRAGSVS